MANQSTITETYNVETEKQLILQCLNNETKTAFTRDYQGWEEHWVHRENISKTYINFSDSTSSESIGWTQISNFMKNFIEENPEPEAPPKQLDEINIQLYHNGAWVCYEQMDSKRGSKRENRLMEKQNGKWKIAAMHTTIYGFEIK